jgi:soluble lytic murein transglycosylase
MSHRWRLLLLLTALAALAACSGAPISRLLATATPTPTATFTATATPTPTNTPPPTSTPTPTPPPVVRVQEGDHQLFNGDWDAAIALYQTALDQQPGTDIAASARFGIATTELRAGNLDRAAAEFTTFLQAFPTDPRVPEAYFQLGAISQAQGTWGLAIQNYEQYLTLRPGAIDSYVWERIGRCYLEWGNYEEASKAYEQAILADRAGGLTGLVEARASVLKTMGNLNGALQLYNLVANSSDSPLTLARMDILRGQIELQLGDRKAANAYFQHAVENYPRTHDAYQSMLALMEGGAPVDDLTRGILSYHAQEYNAALVAFNQYIQKTETPDPRVYYYAGLARRDLNQSFGAINNFQVIIEDYPDSDLWAEAWAEKAYTQWGWDNDYSGAVDTLTQFAQAAPANPAVPEALFEAGRVAERGRELNRAISIWSSLNDNYPDTSEAAEGAFFAGMTLFRQGDYAEAVKQFEIAANHPHAAAERKAAALMWLGKTEKIRGAATAAAAAFDKAAAADPGGYYSLRALELKKGLAPFPPTNGYDFSFNLLDERTEAEEWLAERLNIPNDGSLGYLSPKVATDGRWVRGRELWALGLTAEAKTEFDELRGAYAGDALSLYQMALAFRDLGAYSPAIRAARASVDALGLQNDSFAAPPFFAHLRFGPYYADLITKAAADYDLDSLLLYAVVRQESLFDGTVTSAVAAQGLMQVIPSTGEFIAGKLEWPNYQNSDLYRPFVSVEFGAFYLDFQRDYFKGDLLAALAAYNGGPGNAEIWLGLSKKDPDLFVEVIRFAETRRYVKAVYEFYEIYRGLYGK